MGFEGGSAFRGDSVMVEEGLWSNSVEDSSSTSTTVSDSCWGLLVLFFRERCEEGDWEKAGQVRIECLRFRVGYLSSIFHLPFLVFSFHLALSGRSGELLVKSKKSLEKIFDSLELSEQQHQHQRLLKMHLMYSLDKVRIDTEKYNKLQDQHERHSPCQSLCFGAHSNPSISLLLFSLFNPIRRATESTL